jgi:6,7-dimethyl-8-ribityllumazine synthase
MSTKVPSATGQPIARSAKIAVVAARFNQEIVAELERGCLSRLKELGIAESDIEIVRVPGAFELPLAAKLAARSGRFEAVICLGAVIRGDTPHFEYVAGEAAAGIQRVAIEEALPVIFGVLTTNNEQQARERIGGKHGHAGQRAAEAAVEMIQLRRFFATKRPRSS